MDALCEFATAFPGWMEGGVPRSWAHYQYGMAHLSRARARAALQMAGATGIAWAKKDAADDWYRRQQDAAR